MCCSSVAMCCSVARCIAVWWLPKGRHESRNKGVLHECCSVLLCVAVCCSALQRVGSLKGDMNLKTKVCCSVLQCVAVCWLSKGRHES